MKKCIDCGTDILKRGENIKRCSPCQKEEEKRRRREWNKNNPRPEYYKKYYNENKLKIHRKSHIWNLTKKLIAFSIYSNEQMKCKLCNNEDTDVLTIDHINNDGAEHRKTLVRNSDIINWLWQNNFPDGFRVLCRNCNWKEHLSNLDKKRI